MTYRMEIGLAPEIHDRAIAASPLANLLQSSNWATIKSNWGAVRLSFYEENQLLASCLLLSRQLPLGFSMGYIPRGIAMDYGNRELVRFVLKSLRAYGKTNKMLFIKFDPAVKFDESEKMLSNLTEAGARWTGRTKDMHENIQPRFNAMIYKNKFSEENFDKKMQQFLRKARNTPFEVEIGGSELVADFAQVMKKTEVRKGVALRNADYYRKLLSIYPSDGFLTMLYLKLSALTESLSRDLEACQMAFNGTKNEKKRAQLLTEKNRLTKELTELAKISDDADKIPVAGGLIVGFAGHAEHLYAGFDEAFGKYHPAYLMWLESIKEAFKRGNATLNMGGLENSLSENDGLLSFKKKFKPVIEEYVGEFDLPINRLLYPLAKVAYRLRKTSF
ncbi:MAG: aminoacyltransferase [Streptococcaceae bacterium]|nr:aminoacyltransferase [Streptococcaceae bacterium]